MRDGSQQDAVFRLKGFLSPIPEPSTRAMTILGCAGLAISHTARASSNPRSPQPDQLASPPEAAFFVS
jgi:hypothetical protein